MTSNRSVAPILIASAVASAAIFSLSIVPRTLAQSPKSDATAAVFDAASLKPGGHGFIPYVTGQMKGGPGTDDPSRITYTQILLPTLLMKAWDVEYYQLSGPAWFTTGNTDEEYTITATMPPDTTKDQFRLMLQNLLVERFRMKVHREISGLPGYELVVAQGRSKLNETAQEPNALQVSPLSEVGKDGFMKLPPGRSGGTVNGNGGIRFKCQSYTIPEFMPMLRSFIVQTVGTGFGPIADKTGLTGRYDFKLEFDPHGAAEATVGQNVAVAASRSSDTATDPGSSLPSLFTALEKQLGLKLVKIKSVPVNMLVIDQGDKVPQPN